ncbi:MAG: hypothetical protein LBQ36_04055 [Synergistaceae bacterium]|jgi:hypothetical protein|nr:hypothetical protein [Synergistaceae bacterium]
MNPQAEEAAERIRIAAANTDKLIIRLDTLTNRIDTAHANENRELVEYYERQFAEASAEFMGGVEAILDGWYALRGEARPPADVEYIPPEALESIHETVVSLVQGLPVDLSARLAPNPAIDAAQGVNILVSPDPASSPASRGGPEHQVDVTG